MHQLLHLLIVDRDYREALATACGSRWLLPIVSCTERMRAGPLAAKWLADRGVRGHVVGQWLGRLASTNDAIDWLIIADARRSRGTATPGDLRWMSLDHLKSSPSILDYQQWALEKAMVADVPSTAGPFGSMTWLDRVRNWLDAVAGPWSGLPVFYKITPYEVVLGISTARGALYFKGLTGDRIAEAAITSTLSRELPDTFARTLALEKRADGSAWWLMEECRGTTVAAGLTRERMMLVATALGRVQQQFKDRTDLHVADIDLATVAAWTRALLGERVSSEAADRCEAAIASAHQTLRASELPRSWIPLDLDAGNVLIEDRVVRFIDLDDSRIGAAPLAVSTFLRRARRLQAAGEDWPMWIEAVHRAYAESWTPPLEFGARWRDVDAASALIDCHLGWQRIVQKIERGEVYGVRELAATRTAERLARALDESGNLDSAHGNR